MHNPEQLLTDNRWDDLILNQSSMQMLLEVKNCMEKENICHVLFYGPAGTGKTLAASLLGKELNKDVMRVELAHLVSKYIGETEKNLEMLFSRAEDKSWVLFFDEADALFGKRTKVKDSHDRYANLEVSYLTERIEKFNGLTILATRSKSNIDDTFLRRLQYVIPFPLPEPAERLLLWQKAFAKNNLPITSIDLPQIADKFRLSGAGIMNIAQKLREENFGKSVGAKDSILDQLENL